MRHFEDGNVGVGVGANVASDNYEPVVANRVRSASESSGLRHV